MKKKEYFSIVLVSFFAFVGMLSAGSWSKANHQKTWLAVGENSGIISINKEGKTSNRKTEIITIYDKKSEKVYEGEPVFINGFYNRGTITIEDIAKNGAMVTYNIHRVFDIWNILVLLGGSFLLSWIPVTMVGGFPELEKKKKIKKSVIKEKKDDHIVIDELNGNITKEFKLVKESFDRAEYYYEKLDVENKHIIGQMRKDYKKLYETYVQLDLNSQKKYQEKVTDSLIKINNSILNIENREKTKKENNLEKVINVIIKKTSG